MNPGLQDAKFLAVSAPRSASECCPYNKVSSDEQEDDGQEPEDGSDEGNRDQGDHEKSGNEETGPAFLKHGPTASLASKLHNASD